MDSMNSLIFLPSPASKQYLILSDIIGSHYPASFLTSCLYKNVTMHPEAKTPPPPPPLTPTMTSRLPNANAKISPPPLSYTLFTC